VATSLQSIKRILFYKKRYTSRTPALKKNPQVKGIITKVVTMSPKKPNSAIRHVAKVNLNNKLRVTARIPGIGYICSKYIRR
jgi:small subunit ribosomal protein S12